MPGPPKKPVALKVLEGTYRPDKDGPLAKQVQAAGVPEMPAGLDERAAGLWGRIVPGLAASGVAKAIDATALALMCFWWSQHAQAADDLKAPGLPDGRRWQLLNTCAMCSKQFNSLASRFGMTPADRARIQAEPAAPPATPVPPRKR